MSARELLEQLRAAGASVEAVAGKLRITSPPGTVTPELRQRLLEEKERLLALLVAKPTNAIRDDPTPTEPSYCDRIRAGYVNPGWSAEAWRDRLLQLAERCEAIRPDLATDYRRWAANIQAKSK